MPSHTELLVGVVVAALLVVGLVLRARPVRTVRSVLRRAGAVGEPLVAPPDLRPLAVVVANPSKFHDGGAFARETVQRECLRLGWQEPLWLTTTVAQPGRQQAALALEAGADLVLACGGDGTVRQVATALAGSGVPMGLLPAGTGNLLARNLDLILDDLREATRVALTGDDRPVDVGWMQFDDDPARLFLVMAGMGIDASMMNTPEELKARVGPAAYLVAGVRHLYGRNTRVSITVDAEPMRRRKVRAVVVGNCGKLLGGVVLMPDARLDDGLLDLVTIAPRGVVGWGNVWTSIVTRHRKGHSMLERVVGQRITAVAASPLPAEVDGDFDGWASRFVAWAEPGALMVRVPEGSASVLELFRSSITEAHERRLAAIQAQREWLRSKIETR